METQSIVYFDFLIPKCPVSLQPKRPSLQAWKAYIRSEAAKTWSGNPPCAGIEIQLTLVYLYENDPVDTDNIIKPIQDALIGLIYDDDALITDVESHRRSVNGTFDLTRCPPGLIAGIVAKEECVFVRVCMPKLLEEYL